MRRLIALFVCFAFLFVAGCGSSEEQEEKVEMEPGVEEPMEPREPMEPAEPAEPMEPAESMESAEPMEPAPAPEPEMEAETQPEEESSAVMLGDIDLNSASSSQFQQLRGVGPATASSIIEYREQNGSFSSVDELNNVSGIGPATLKKMKAAAGMEVEESSEPTASTTGSGDININTASNSQLQNITGVGPSTAGSIIEYREQNGPFGSVEELTNVSGIGAKTLEKMKPQITVGE